MTAPVRAVTMTALVLLHDQSLKMMVRQEISLCEESRLSACEHIAVGWRLRLVSLENAGSPLGFAQGLDLWTMLAFVSLLLIPLYGRRLEWRRPLPPIAIGLQAGGAVSNLFDRLLVGGVTDYLAVSGVSLAINLADVTLVIGALLAARELRRGTMRNTGGSRKPIVRHPGGARDAPPLR